MLADETRPLLQGSRLTALELSAPPGTFTPDAWDPRSRALFDSIDTELLKLERSGLVHWVLDSRPRR